MTEIELFRAVYENIKNMHSYTCMAIKKQRITPEFLKFNLRRESFDFQLIIFN